MEDRGGVLGDALLRGSSTLFSSVGAHIIAIFLFIAGVLLVTGASIAGVLRATGSGVSTTTRRLRETEVLPRRATRNHAGQGAEPPSERRERLLPPDDDTSEMIVRATHVEAPSLDGAARYPDIFGEDDEPSAEEIAASLGAGRRHDEDGDEHDHGDDHEPADLDDDATHVLEHDDEDATAVVPRRPDPEQLTPQGNLRAEALDDPDFVWRLPDPGRLTHSTADQARPDTAGQEKVAAALVEALGHFSIEAQVVGMVAGPHITRYELRLAPGIKVGKVAQLKDDLAYALAASDIRILAPIPGKQAVGVEVPNKLRRIVHLGDVYQEPPKDWSPLTVWLGKDVSGRAIGADLAKMPHILVAGTTGAGKSGVRQRDALEHPAARDAARGQARPRRPQAGRAQPLRLDPAPAHAGHHEPAEGCERTAEPRRARWSRATRSCRSRARATSSS